MEPSQDPYVPHTEPNPPVGETQNAPAGDITPEVQPDPTADVDAPGAPTEPAASEVPPEVPPVDPSVNEAPSVPPETEQGAADVPENKDWMGNHTVGANAVDPELNQGALRKSAI